MALKRFTETWEQRGGEVGDKNTCVTRERPIPKMGVRRAKTRQKKHGDLK